MRSPFSQLKQFAIERVQASPPGMRRKLRKLVPFVEQNAPRNDPDALIAMVDRFTDRVGRVMNIGPGKGEILERAIEKNGVERTLELGTFFGYSAVRVARMLPPEGRVTTIEADPEYYEIARWFVDYAGLANRIKIRFGPTEEVIPTLEGDFDAVLIDHFSKYYLRDLRSLEDLGLLAPGALVASDNVGIFKSALGPYLDHVRTGERYRSTFHPVGRDGIELSVSVT